MLVHNKRSAVKKLRQLIFTPKSETASFRAHLENTFCIDYIPNNVERTVRHVGNIECDILSPEAVAQNRIMLYVHGGSFVGGSRNSWRSFCASLAHASSTRTVVPEFRLAPEHPFPAALDDIQAVLKELIAAGNNVIIAADTSGASIALAAVFNMKPKYRGHVREIILFSPWLDMSPASPLFTKKKAADAVMSADALRRCADIYTYRSNLVNPLVSPMYATAENLDNFPCIYFQTGSDELMYWEVQRFADVLKTNGVRYIIDVWNDMISMFQMADEYLNDAHLAVERVGAHIKSLSYTAEAAVPAAGIAQEQQ